MRTALAVIAPRELGRVAHLRCAARHSHISLVHVSGSAATFRLGLTHHDLRTVTCALQHGTPHLPPPPLFERAPSVTSSRRAKPFGGAIMRDAPSSSFPVFRTSQAASAAFAISIALTLPCTGQSPSSTHALASGEGCSECYAYLENPHSEHASDPPSHVAVAHETDPSTTWPTGTSTLIKR